MTYRSKVDTSLQERHSILDLLERLKKENITVGEMEEIGNKLRKSGKRALQPIVRRLWREKSSDLISKYAYLLDYFEDQVWLDQLIRITLTRSDLEVEGKSALLSALESCGVDITRPPFAKLLESVGGPLTLTLPRLLDKGEEGLLLFMEDFLNYPSDVRLGIIAELPKVQDQRVIRIARMLLYSGLTEVPEATLQALGRIRTAASGALLRDFIRNGERALREAATRSLRRLAFVGVDVTAPAQPYYEPDFVHAVASPFDGGGYRSVWFARRRSDGTLDSLWLQLNEGSGIVDAVSYSHPDERDFEELLREREGEEYLIPVRAGYALTLLRDGLHLSYDGNFSLPADLYVRRDMFAGYSLDPEAYFPNFDRHNLDRIGSCRDLVAETGSLLEEDYFSDWVLAEPETYDAAEKWTEMEAAGRHREMRTVVEHFCRDVVTPQVEQIARRLFLTADLMEQTGAPRDLVERTLAAALSIPCAGSFAHAHPFLRRVAVESIHAAAEALAEGYDLRRDDGDWEAE